MGSTLSSRELYFCWLAGTPPFHLVHDAGTLFQQVSAIVSGILIPKKDLSTTVLSNRSMIKVLMPDTRRRSPVVSSQLRESWRRISCTKKRQRRIFSARRSSATTNCVRVGQGGRQLHAAIGFTPSLSSCQGVSRLGDRWRSTILYLVRVLHSIG